MKTSELEGALLAEWVARAEGHIIYRQERPGAEAAIVHVLTPEDEMGFSQQLGTLGSGPAPYAPHENWAQGGPIIERERINIVDHAEYHRITGPRDDNRPDQFAAFIGDPYQLSNYGDFDFYGAQKGRTHLIAAMRDYVASKFGDTVPDEVPHG